MSLESCIDEMLRFGRKSYQSANWELIIGGSSEFKGVLALLQIPCPQARRQEAINAAAVALRTRYPELSRGARLWNAKQWDRAKAREIVETIRDAALECLSATCDVKPVPYASQQALAVARNLGSHQWAPWQPFVRRQFVPAQPGLYLFGRFLTDPPAKVDPLESRVIYIGMTADSLESRLCHFANSWHGKTGHSGSFTLRTWFLSNCPDEALHGHTLFVSWMWFPPEEIDSIRDHERTLIEKYRKLHGAWPLGNGCG